LDTSNPIGKFVFGLLAQVVQPERKFLIERTKEFGINFIIFKRIYFNVTNVIIKFSLFTKKSLNSCYLFY
jgi:DNA invertase Pin-like site-specific DNA recombinase